MKNYVQNKLRKEYFKNIKKRNDENNKEVKIYV